MSLLPDRHPNLDFFVLDIADAVPKDDMASMEHPLFSLATKPDMRHLEYRSGDNVLKIRLSVPKGSKFGSERVKLWFRKGQTCFTWPEVPDRSNIRVPERSKSSYESAAGSPPKP